MRGARTIGMLGMSLAVAGCSTHPTPRPASAGADCPIGVAVDHLGCVAPDRGLPLHIAMDDQMGGSFALQRAAIAVDDQMLFNRKDEQLFAAKQFPVFKGRALTGAHRIAVELVYRGQGHGVFSYLKGYRFKVRGSHEFEVDFWKKTHVKVIAYETGGPTAALEDRPTLRFEVSAEPQR